MYIDNCLSQNTERSEKEDWPYIVTKREADRQADRVISFPGVKQFNGKSIKEY